jgi:hypothetical protein
MGCLMNKHDLYFNAFYNTITNYKKACNEHQTQNIKATIKKLIIYGVKTVNTKPKPEYIEIEEARSDFQFADMITNFMGTLTPIEFMNLYPIAKTYDGDKYECKDYFSTMDYIKGLNQKQPIGKEIMNLLWDYQNWELRNFNVRILSYMSNLRQLDGHASLFEEFADTVGLDIQTMHTDSNGTQFVLDKKTGKTTKLNKSKPKYLRMV